MYQNIFILLGLIHCLELRQRNGLLGHLKIKTDELKGVSDLSIKISDATKVFTFDKTAMTYKKKGALDVLLGSTDVKTNECIFDIFRSDFLMEFQFVKSGRRVAKQIFFERKKGKNKFRISSPEKHLSLLIKKLVDLIIKTEDEGHNFKSILEEIKETYFSYELIWKVINSMCSMYIPSDEENAKNMGVNDIDDTISNEQFSSKRGKQLESYLRACAQSVRDNYLIDKYQRACDLNLPCFPALFPTSETSSIACSIFNSLYHKLAQKTSSTPAFDFFDLSIVKFSVKFEKCVVFQSQPSLKCDIYEEQDYLNDKQGMLVLDDDKLQSPGRTFESVKEEGISMTFSNSENYSVIDVMVKRRMFKDSLKKVPYNIFDSDIYIQNRILSKKKIKFLRIYYKYESELETTSLDIEISWSVVNCRVYVENISETDSTENLLKKLN